VSSTTDKAPPHSKENPQAAVAKKAAALRVSRASPMLPAALVAANVQHKAEAGLTTDNGRDQHVFKHVHAARTPPAVRLMDKHEITAITGVCYVSLWSWMRAGKFPRSRIVGGKSMLRSDEVKAWLDALPLRKLKGDDAAEAGASE
jgi:predicted DNA-binding transcriptional regulator AlpA